MIKLSEAEKKRRKEKAILDYSEHLLNIIWACRDETMYNGHTWSKKEQGTYLQMWNAFEKGCMLADGRKWNNKLQKQWIEYEAVHGKPVGW